MSRNRRHKLNFFIGEYKVGNKPSFGFVWIILFLIVSVVVGVKRVEIWPLSTYSMFNNGQKDRKYITVLRPAILMKNNTPRFIPFSLANRWNREKYIKALRAKRLDLVKLYLMDDCKEQFENTCSSSELAVVRRRMQKLRGGQVKESTKVIVKYSDID